MPTFPTPKHRLRQLETISGRGLLLDDGSKSRIRTAYYVTLSARHAGSAAQQHAITGGAGADSGWQLVYRTEEVAGTLNPEWRPLAWDHRKLLQGDPLLDSCEVQVLLALHALEGAQPAAPTVEWLSGLARAEAAPAAVREAVNLQQPVQYDAASRPRFQMALEGPGASTAAVEVRASSVPKCGVQHQGVAREHNQNADTQPFHQSNEQNGLLNQKQQQQQVDSVGKGQEMADTPHLGQQQNWTDAATADLPARHKQDVDAESISPRDSISPAAVEQVQGPNVAPASLCSLTSTHDAAAAASAPEESGFCAERAAAALASTGCCPGRLVSAWRLSSLDQLFPAGADLVELKLPLRPNTLVLQFTDGLFLCPPPLQPEQPASQHASPLKKAGSQAAAAGAVDLRADGMPAAAAQQGATRRFANLLVSKLLRSAPNLQDVASVGSEGLLDGGAYSDAESEASSEVTTASLRTSTTAGGGEAAAGGSRGAVAAASTAGATPAASSAGVKTLTLAGVQQYIASLAALKGRLRDLIGRSQALQEQLQARLVPRSESRQQQATLAALRAEAAACRRRAAEVQQELADVQAAEAATRKQATVRVQALVTTLKVMQAASRRVGEAEASLAGEAARGALVSVLRELVARRCQMVCQLGTIFQLGPTAVSIPETPPGGFLEDRLDQRWAGAASGSGSSGLATAPAWAAGGFGSGSIHDSPSKYRQEMRLSIGGLELPPSVWRKAFEEGGSGGYEWDADEDLAAGVAVGYVAQMVDRLGAYLDVPLRYPLLLRGSRSAVADNYPPVGSWAAEADVGRRRASLFGRGDAPSSSGAAGDRGPVEYPLYCDSNRERPRFAVGVFLLNKDVIQLLQAHGISAAGPNHLLQNVYKLLLAAQSAVPVPRLPQHTCVPVPVPPQRANSGGQPHLLQRRVI